LQNIYDRLISKASKSICKHRVAALGLDAEGRIVNCKFNRPRFSKKGGGVHAELDAIKDQRVKSVVICRISSAGRILPLEPCLACRKVLNKLKIKILSISDVVIKKRGKGVRK
jgi:cytidine deaminase